MPESVTTKTPSQEQGPSQTPHAPQTGSSTSGNGHPSSAAAAVSGRSPGLIMLVAGFALLLISIQSISEVSELLFQHVDDSLLEDGAFFASIDVPGGEDMHSLNDYNEHTDVNEGSSSSNSTSSSSSSAPPRPAAAMDRDDVITLKLRVADVRDQYGLFQTHFSKHELSQVFESCAKIWLSQANIRLEFTHVNIQLEAAEEDAHRWFVLGAKDQRKAAFWKDVSRYLRKGSSKMAPKQTSEVIARYLQASGYPLMDWITSKAQISAVTSTNSGDQPILTIVPVAYWPWNNGGVLGKRVFLRTGSCSTPPLMTNLIATEKPKRLGRKKLVAEEETILCNGWPASVLVQAKPSIAEAARALAHLLGTLLALKRVGGERCVLSRSSSVPIGLMCVPSAEARGLEEFYTRAVHLSAQERLQARTSLARYTT